MPITFYFWKNTAARKFKITYVGRTSGSHYISGISQHWDQTSRLEGALEVGYLMAAVSTGESRPREGQSLALGHTGRATRTGTLLPGLSWFSVSWCSTLGCPQRILQQQRALGGTSNSRGSSVEAPAAPAQSCLRPLAMPTAHPDIRRVGDFSGWSIVQ